MSNYLRKAQVQREAIADDLQLPGAISERREGASVERSEHLGKESCVVLVSSWPNNNKQGAWAI